MIDPCNYNWKLKNCQSTCVIDPNPNPYLGMYIISLYLWSAADGSPVLSGKPAQQTLVDRMKADRTSSRVAGGTRTHSL